MRNQTDKKSHKGSAEIVAGNGLLHRRALLRHGAALAGASVGIGAIGAGAEPLSVDPSTLEAGTVIPPYERPSAAEKKAARTLTNPDGGPRVSAARTPLHMLNGTITPNGLHFVIARTGFPNIDPDRHRLAIHGLVRQPLVFTLEALERYPMVSRIAFIECGGNSAPFYSSEPLQGTIQALHGLVSCAEWTGVRLSTLLEEAGVDPRAKWVVAEGGDAATVNRSVPIGKAMDDAIIALFQNGERIMPSNGYPMRLVLPGYEGNMSIKWLRRLKLTDAPVMSIHEMRYYTMLRPDGKAYQLFFPQEVKSFITHPSPGMMLKGRGFYEISGIAYSGNGPISKVEVSADGGKSWAEAALQAPVLSKAFTRFRMPWRWEGAPAVLQSRATDEAGNVQPTRAELIADRGQTKAPPPMAAIPNRHFNAITSWAINAAGETRNVYV
jgi:sulfane dehydrogenase subunit SoxC